ncbi:transporter [Halosimplex salinum]|uniref:transporter n=1 Tax=Halosimplex salinum TaxID=1710538 RepID=UPI000F482A6A|nr:transporter [Halosimplex salinum]
MADTKRVAGGGLAGGIAAWVVGYLVVYLLNASEIENSLGSGVLEALTNENVTWKLVGWIFYNAHNVTVKIPGLFGQTSQNFVAGSEEAALTALFVVPPVLLVAAGVAAAWNTAADPTTAARNGAGVVLGYLPLSVLGVFLFAVSVGDATAGPNLVTGALLAGAVYPFVFGAVGGLVGGHLSAE